MEPPYQRGEVWSTKKQKDAVYSFLEGFREYSRELLLHLDYSWLQLSVIPALLLSWRRVDRRMVHVFQHVPFYLPYNADDWLRSAWMANNDLQVSGILWMGESARRRRTILELTWLALPNSNLSSTLKSGGVPET